MAIRAEVSGQIGQNSENRHLAIGKSPQNKGYISLLETRSLGSQPSPPRPVPFELAVNVAYYNTGAEHCGRLL